MGQPYHQPETVAQRKTAPSTVRRPNQVLLTLALSIGALYFVLRGPVRALAPGGSGDFVTHYNATRTYLNGGNPYVREDVIAEAIQSGRDGRIPAINPHLLLQPGALLLFTPFALVPLKLAVWLWLCVELTATAFLWWGAMRLVEVPPRARVAFTTALLFLSPIHSAIAHGQVSLIFCGVTINVLWMLKNRRPLLAGIGLGMLVTKVTFGLPVALPSAFLGRAKVLLLAGVIASAAWFPMAVRYGIEQPVVDYFASLEDAADPGGTADDTRANDLNYHQLNVRSWWYSWGLPSGLTEGLAALSLAVLALALFRGRGLALAAGSSDWYWSLAAIFTCISVYHRFYDAALLAIPLAAAVKHWPASLARAAAVLVLPFAAPGASAMRYFTQDFAPRSPWFEALIVRHDALCLLLLGFLLAWSIARPAISGAPADYTSYAPSRKAYHKLNLPRSPSASLRVCPTSRKS